MSFKIDIIPDNEIDKKTTELFSPTDLNLTQVIKSKTAKYEWKWWAKVNYKKFEIVDPTWDKIVNNNHSPQSSYLFLLVTWIIKRNKELHTMKKKVKIKNVKQSSKNKCESNRKFKIKMIRFNKCIPSFHLHLFPPLCFYQTLLLKI